MMEKGKATEPLGFRKEGLECYYSKNRRIDSSAKGGVHSALIIDHKERKYAFLSGVEYMVDTPSETYLSKVKLLPSTAKVKEECRKLIKAGYVNSPVEPAVLDSYRYKADRTAKYIIKENTIER